MTYCYLDHQSDISKYLNRTILRGPNEFYYIKGDSEKGLFAKTIPLLPDPTISKTKYLQLYKNNNEGIYIDKRQFKNINKFIFKEGYYYNNIYNSVWFVSVVPKIQWKKSACTDVMYISKLDRKEGHFFPLHLRPSHEYRKFYDILSCLNHQPKYTISSAVTKKMPIFLDSTGSFLFVGLPEVRQEIMYNVYFKETIINQIKVSSSPKYTIVNEYAPYYEILKEL